jgi:ankyrin repeat protein
MKTIYKKTNFSLVNNHQNFYISHKMTFKGDQMNKLAAISLVVFLQAVQVAQAASGEKGSDKPDDSRPARFAGTGGAAGGAERADLAAYAARVLEGSDEFLPGMEEKFTPLTKAIFDGNYGELVRLVGLRKDGTPTYDVNEVDEEGETPLLAAIHYAENFDDPWAVVDLLLKNGAYKSVNIGDKKGITPLSQVLHNIIYSGGSGAFLKVLSALLGAGADVNKESAGNIPLYKLLHSDGIKAELEVCEAAQLLLAYGAVSGPLYIKKKKSGL